MSVVQISRIQQRRGRKNTNYGFPQLASGELGWAIDTQELYIGNGAVSEGAPYVGNSKILTEHDDILQFVDLYQYKKNDPTIQTGSASVQPVTQSLQSRLDNLVSIREFGGIGDGIVDDTLAFQRAIDQLFLNDATKENTSSRVVLYIEPGEYLISNEIRIPPYAHIVGAGIDSTIIHQTEDYAIFRFVDSISTPDDYTDFASMSSLERPRNILISSLSLETDSNRIIYLDNTDSTLFDRVKFVGVYLNGTTPNENQIGVEIRGASRVFRSDNVLFHYCIFNNTGYGIFSDSDHNNINIENCIFYQLYDAISIGGNDDGSINTSITNCYFDLIDRYGIRIKKGYGNISNHNKFMLVGNDNEGYANAVYPIVKFDTDGNQSIGDYFERNRKLKDQNNFAYLAFIPSIQSSGMIYDNINFHKTIDITLGSPIVFLRLPLFDSGKYIIDYVIKKTSFGASVRSGTMNVTVDIDNELSDLSDSYSYTGDSSVENIVFTVGLQKYGSEATIPDTLTINIFNPSGNGVGTMNYTYRMLTQ